MGLPWPLKRRFGSAAAPFLTEVVIRLRAETTKILERYERRQQRNAISQWAATDNYVLFARQERERALVQLLKMHFAGRELEALSCLEIGCGRGNNLAQLVQLGFDPSNLTGNELLPYQADAAEHRLPASVAILRGDALDLPVADSSLDIVYQSTVFSSILDGQFQAELAQRMWNWTKPGGGILWYDFTVSNPHNPDVRGVPVSRIRKLFPAGRVHVKKVTLAPPVGRRIARFGQHAYSLFNALPVVRTHVFCWIKKDVG